MKKILFCGVILFFIGCATAPAPIEKIQKQQVYELTDMKKDQIFKKSNQWLAEKFVSSNTIVQYKDASEGKIICQIATTVFSGLYMQTLTFYTTMTIDIKDGRSRLTLLANEMADEQMRRTPVYDYETNINYAKESYEPIFISYKDYMLNKATKKDDNW